MTTATTGQGDGGSVKLGGDALPAAAGNPPASTGADDKGSTSSGADPFAGLQDAGNREWLKSKGAKGLDDVVTSYRSLEQAQSASVVIPGANAKPEDWDRFYQKLGRPDKPEAYTLKPPASVPADVAWDKDTEAAFRTAAHKAGLPDKMAGALMETFVGETMSRLGNETKQRVETAVKDLENAWGSRSGEAFKTAVLETNRGLDVLEPVGKDGKPLLGTDGKPARPFLAALKEAGLLGPGGEVLNATLALGFQKIGKILGGEHGGGGANQGETAAENPFADGASFNRTAQAKLFKSEPDRARKFIQMAGKKPSDFGLT